MKSILDDQKYAQSQELFNDLSAKKTKIDREIDELWSILNGDQSSKQTTDPIEAALALDPGVDATPKTDAERYRTLVKQSAQLKKALDIQYTANLGIARDAGYRVFAANSANYLKHSAELLAAVDRLIELNAVLEKDQAILREKGCHDIIEIHFPSFGLTAQMPFWRDSLDEQIRGLNYTQRVHSNV